MSKLPIADIPTLAGLEALAARCKAGDPDALQEYPEAARALLEESLATMREWLTIEQATLTKAYEDLWRRLADLNGEILDAAERRQLLEDAEKREGWMRPQRKWRAASAVPEDEC